jgi:maleylacetoacetate isomerase
MKFYTYYRSSSSFRVRIALNWKGLAYQPVFVHLAKGEQKEAAHLERNPQGLVPVLEDGGVTITQSAAIIEYLEEKYPEKPLLPKNTAARAKVRSLVNLIACDIQPLNNLKVLKYLKNPLGHSEEEIGEWYRHWITLSFAALEQAVARDGKGFCFGDAVTMADCFFLPQVWNARRFKTGLEAFPNLLKVEAALLKLPAFEQALPENQPDFEKP